MEEEQPKVGPKGEGVGTTESKVTESTEVDWSVVQSDEHRACYQKMHEAFLPSSQNSFPGEIKPGPGGPPGRRE